MSGIRHASIFASCRFNSQSDVQWRAYRYTHRRCDAWPMRFEFHISETNDRNSECVRITRNCLTPPLKVNVESEQLCHSIKFPPQIRGNYMSCGQSISGKTN